ncbi:MAG: hypothetical protein QOG94_2652 [Solirubrobacteraceae bacterium]|nr:hypothetical protein [Solirubrobacteraceae bacterium]MEA2139129.1 hypothetical protein [Solirubrobacteraceae bacterium]
MTALASARARMVPSLMDTFLVLVFLALIAGGAFVFMRGRRQQASAGPAGPAALPQAPAPEPIGGADVRALKVGDVVNYEGGDYIVEGTLRFDQGGFRWQEHRLVDGPKSLWLSVEDDEGLEIVVWKRLKGAALEPGPGTLEHVGVTYELDERGRANFTSEGTTGAPGGGKAEFVDYESGGRRLSFERYGDDGGWEISAGHVISEHVLDIYPSRGAGG